MEEYLLREVTSVFVGSDRTDERTKHIYERFKSKNIIEVDCDKDEKYHIFSAGNSYNCYVGTLYRTIKHCLGESGSVILVDITSMKNIAIMGLTQALMGHIKPDKIFASYVLPERYVKEGNDFSFTRSFGQVGYVRGFAKHTRPPILIPFIGFEGRRLPKITGEANGGENKYSEIHPIVGFPSKNPRWRLISIQSCISSITGVPKIYPCNSHSVFEAIEKIKEIHEHVVKKINEDKEKKDEKKIKKEDMVLLSPLGTRPHTLAVSIYATSNNCGIIYDFPDERPNRTIGTGEVIIYHLTSMIP